MLLLGWAWLTVCLIVLGIVTQSTAFILFRALAGLGPAFMMPNAVALLGAAFKPSVLSL